jgi:hypothetical protein
VAVLRKTDPDRPWRGALVMTGAALAVTTPRSPGTRSYSPSSSASTGEPNGWP